MQATRKKQTYVSIKAPGHPLSWPDGRAAEHRVVLYAVIGPGAHRCHWCNKIVIWRDIDPNVALVVDHLDEDTHNNDPANLVPSCSLCNANRWLTDRCRVGHDLSEPGSWRLRSNGYRDCVECRRASWRRDNPRRNERRRAQRAARRAAQPA